MGRRVGGRARSAGAAAPIEDGAATLRRDRDRPGGWLLTLDGYPQSYVDVDDPTRLEFEYVRRLASVLDFVAPPGAPLRVLHLGGGALTLPRYLAATRPGSAQRVVERDAALVALVRRVLPLPRADLRVRVGDAREVVASLGPARFDVVIGDVYGGGRMPGRLGTVEFATLVARALRPGGVYAVNLADGAPMSFTRGQVATLAAVFADVCAMAEPSVWRGRRFGNVVLAAAGSPGRLPVDDLAAACARDPFPVRLVRGADLERFVAGARSVTDAEAVDSPAPPPALFP